MRSPGQRGGTRGDSPCDFLRVSRRHFVWKSWLTCHSSTNIKEEFPATPQNPQPLAFGIPFQDVLDHCVAPDSEPNVQPTSKEDGELWVCPCAPVAASGCIRPTHRLSGQLIQRIQVLLGFHQLIGFRCFRKFVDVLFVMLIGVSLGVPRCPEPQCIGYREWLVRFLGQGISRF